MSDSGTELRTLLTCFRHAIANPARPMMSSVESKVDEAAAIYEAAIPFIGQRAAPVHLSYETEVDLKLGLLNLAIEFADAAQESGGPLPFAQKLYDVATNKNLIQFGY